MESGSPTAETARRRRNPEATRAEILAAARTVMASDGPEGLSLSKVAHLAGVNRGTAYQHFETREDLVKATVSGVSDYLVETVFGHGRNANNTQDPTDFPVFEVISNLVDFAVENPELGRIWLFETLASDNPGEDKFFRRFKEATESLSGSEYSEPGIDAEAHAVTLLAGCFLWPVWVKARARSRKERNEMARRMRREMLRLSLHGTLRAERFPQLEKLLES
jgi:AcrR family transcriptional regulator